MTSGFTRTPSNEMVMAEAFAHLWAPPGQKSACRHTVLRVPQHIIRSSEALLVLMVFALIIGVLAFPLNSLAAESEPGKDKIFVPQGPLNFDSCAQLAIKQSPYFTKSKIEMEIRKLNEDDSRYTIFPPPVTFYSYYYVNQPQQSATPFSLTFTTTPYNPVGSYFSLQAQKIATKMAILAHLKLINQGLEQVGRMFLELDSMKRTSALQDSLISLCRESLSYAQNSFKTGTGTSLEVKVATQDLELAQVEKDRLETSKRRTLASLKTYLGLKPGQTVEFDLRDAPRQVLGDFDPATSSLDQAKARSFDLKAMEYQGELQRFNVALARIDAFPKLVFNIQNPSPLYATSATGIYVGVGLEIPVWDGFKRIRNISRQKAVLKQFEADKDIKENDLTDKWTSLQDDIKSDAANLKINQSQEELEHLKLRQAEIRYHSGSEPLTAWIDARKAYIGAQKTSIKKSTEHYQSLLNLRQFSGDLGYRYVDQNSWQK